MILILIELWQRVEGKFFQGEKEREKAVGKQVMVSMRAAAGTAARQD